jgi:hypothetical protein
MVNELNGHSDMLCIRYHRYLHLSKAAANTTNSDLHESIKKAWCMGLAGIGSAASRSLLSSGGIRNFSLATRSFYNNNSATLPITCYPILDAPLIFNKTTTDINMKHTFIASFTLPIAYGKMAGELCRGTGTKAADGNWYCSEVQTITYRNISQTGAYNQTTSVDPTTGICGHKTIGYDGTGPLTPLFGEVSPWCTLAVQH